VFSSFERLAVEMDRAAYPYGATPATPLLSASPAFDLKAAKHIGLLRKFVLVL